MICDGCNWDMVFLWFIGLVLDVIGLGERWVCGVGSLWFGEVCEDLKFSIGFGGFVVFVGDVVGVVWCSVLGDFGDIGWWKGEVWGDL